MADIGMEKIYLFTDYRGQFYSSTKHRGAAVDLARLKEYFVRHNFELVVLPFSKIDFRTQDYKDKWILYQSSEDPGLFYRSYVDDIVLTMANEAWFTDHARQTTTLLTLFWRR